MCKNFIYLLALLLFFGCSNEKPKSQTPPPPFVGVLEAKSGDIDLKFNYPAQIISDQNVEIVAKVSGTIVKQFVKAGQNVQEGDKLFLIDPLKYEAAYAIALANFKKSDMDYKRALKLQKQKAISQKEFDSAKAAFLVAEANLKNSKIDLDYTEVKAPFSGVVGDNLKDVGSFVSVGVSLIRLTKLNPIYAKFSIPDIDALEMNKNLYNKDWVQISSDANLTTDSGNFAGKVIFIDKVISKNGALEAKAEFLNDDLRLLPGSYGSILMSGFKQKNGFLVPQIAIKQDVAGAYVLILDQGIVNKKRIKIVFQDDINAVVSEGIKNGDKIIMDNFKKIRVGSPATQAKGN